MDLAKDRLASQTHHILDDQIRVDLMMVESTVGEAKRRMEVLVGY
jgi:hypothetical protein